MQFTPVKPEKATRFLEGIGFVEVVSHVNCGPCANYYSRTQKPLPTGTCKLSGKPVYCGYDCTFLTVEFMQNTAAMRMCNEKKLYDYEVARHPWPRLVRKSELEIFVSLAGKLPKIKPQKVAKPLRRSQQEGEEFG